MPLLFVRSLVPFQRGANSTDVVINEVHFNRTTLEYYDYTLYSNGTLSNGTNCYLAFEKYQPHMFGNGSFVNGTSCYTPVYGLGQRASIGMAFAILFALSIVFTLINLRKHGRRYLPLDRRWSVVGRRWKWYWLLVVAVCGTISCFMSIDVDRNYLQSTPLILQSVFYTLLTPIVMAAVWEAVRHWGSWQERQICDRDPYAFTQSSTRERQEFWLPLAFYLFAFSNLFLTVPRAWTPIQLQRSLEQQDMRAKPAATDARFKSAGFVALMGILVICYSLEHSIYRYVPRPSGMLRQAFFYFQAAPSHFLVAIALLGVKIGYAIASAFDWSVSPLRYDVNSGWIYGLGYAPVLLIVILFNLCGYCELNEDKLLIVQRGEHERALDNELGIGRRKPSWWKNPRIRAFAQEVGATTQNTERSLEMGVLCNRQEEQGEDKKDNKEANVFTRSASQSSETTNPFADSNTERSVHVAQVQSHHLEDNSRDSRRCSSSDSTAADVPAQTVRSMLDV